MNEKNAVGSIIVSKHTKRILLNLRSPDKNNKTKWGFWGGMMEDSDTSPKDTLLRELEEEMGFVPQIERIYPFDIFETANKHFRYYTFVCVVDEEFIPVLNQESVGYGWFDKKHYPSNLHQGAYQTLNKKNNLEKIKIILDQH